MSFKLKLVGGESKRLKTAVRLVDRERALKVGRALATFMRRVPCLGVAANQFGIMERVCAAKIQVPGQEGTTIRIFIDPRITHRSGSQTNIEGCLSWPGVTGEVKRPTSLTVDFLAYDPPFQKVHPDTWERSTETFTGFDAVKMEHEIDHLDGIRCIDKMKNKKTR